MDPVQEFGGEEETAVAAPVTAPETADQRVARLEQEFGTLRASAEARQQEQPALNQLLADPDVRAVLAAKQAGRPVRFASDEPTPEPPEETIDWAALTPDQTAVKMNQLVERRARKIAAETVAPLQQRTSQIEQQFTQQQVAAASAEIERLRKQNPDFDNLRPKMLELHRQYGGQVPPEDLYLLARQKTGKPAPADERRVVETERPTHSAARPPQRAVPQGTNQRAHGRAALAAAFDRVLSDVPVPTFSG